MQHTTTTEEQARDINDWEIWAISQVNVAALSRKLSAMSAARDDFAAAGRYYGQAHDAYNRAQAGFLAAELLRRHFGGAR